jgi:hypothetical protein
VNQTAAGIFGRHRALAFVLLSLIAWSVWNLTRDAAHPYMDLSKGVYTDHFSHMNTARIFTQAGIDIWRKPLRELGQPLTEAQRAALPEDIRTSAAATPQGEVFAVEGWPTDKPFISSWTHNPRFHPPGDMVLTAPVAAVYSFTGLSFTEANRWLIQLFLVYSHVAIWFFFRAGLTLSRLKPVGFLVMFIVYGEIIHWTLEGFYEAAILPPLILCARWLYERKAVHAIFAFTVAANVHFRAYFFAPWAVLAAVVLIKDRQWRSWGKKEFALAYGSVALGFVSLGVFGLIFDALGNIQGTTRVSLTVDPVNWPAIITLVVVAGVIGGVLAYGRAWLDLAVLGWFVVMVFFLREALFWDILTLLAWLAAPIESREDRWQIVRDARLAALAFLAFFVFHDGTFLNPEWLEKVFA